MQADRTWGGSEGVLHLSSPAAKSKSRGVMSHINTDKTDSRGAFQIAITEGGQKECSAVDLKFMIRLQALWVQGRSHVYRDLCRLIVVRVKFL